MAWRFSLRSGEATLSPPPEGAGCGLRMNGVAASVRIGAPGLLGAPRWELQGKTLTLKVDAGGPRVEFVVEKRLKGAWVEHARLEASVEDGVAAAVLGDVPRAPLRFRAREA